MIQARRLLFIGSTVAALGACGGGGGSSGPPTNSFTGTITVTSSSAAAVCGTTKDVHFIAGAVDSHLEDVAGGDCVRFTNSDTVNHHPAGNPPGSCAQVDAAPVLAAGASFTAGPFPTARACYWQDALNPPSAGGGY